jgi:hypothetical protein
MKGEIRLARARQDLIDIFQTVCARLASVSRAVSGPKSVHAGK